MLGRGICVYISVAFPLRLVTLLARYADFAVLWSEIIGSLAAGAEVGASVAGIAVAGIAVAGIAVGVACPPQEASKTLEIIRLRTESRVVLFIILLFSKANKGYRGSLLLPPGL